MGLQRKKRVGDSVVRTGPAVRDMEEVVNGESVGSTAGYQHYLANEDRYGDIDKVLDRRGPWTDEEFQAGQAVGGRMSGCLAEWNSQRPSFVHSRRFSSLAQADWGVRSCRIWH